MRYLRYLALLSILAPAVAMHAQAPVYQDQNGYAAQGPASSEGYDAGADPNYNGNYAAPAEQQQYAAPADPEYAQGPVEPVCPYGYYPSYPYACAPYGYWAPNYFVDGFFLGAGPWFRGWGWRPAYGYRGGYYGGYRGGVAIRGGYGYRGGVRGGVAVGGFRGAPVARGFSGGGFRGNAGGSFHGNVGGGFHGNVGGGFHGGGGGHGGGRR